MTSGGDGDDSGREGQEINDHVNRSFMDVVVGVGGHDGRLSDVAVVVAVGFSVDVDLVV